ncbi:efflux RND transporter periplasmic adaptor subunit [Vibrio qinghaiensis]|uniref:Efflux RND transporter periplasmic adaptor subunit n=1 Tax=Vibrio qinghaiensis TaxID=2025808 RepID=A0A223MX32_9VIBR|nr:MULTISPECIES: efflux RND transporter periplasmic adaptor subunit [Vibrio]ASU22128.1 efflux RND transporter periplasmic adaptor subunit [Vibrio qinghaiensis]
MNKLLVLCWFSLPVLVACGKAPLDIPEPESRPAKLFTVLVGNTQDERQFPATTEAGDKAVLAFRVPGQLQSIDVTAGRQVARGDVLASLNPDEYALLEKQAQANFMLANVQFERYKKLRKDKVVSEQDFDQAQANHNSARAMWEQAKANLRYTQLIAPYDGTISIIPAENHEYIAAKQGVMNIQTNQILKVVFQLPDHLLSRFANGARFVASIQFDSFPDREFELQFQEIDTEADPKTGSYRVSMIMDRPSDIGILPGMVGTVRVASVQVSATHIPRSALLVEEGKISVWRVNEQGIVEKSQVELNDKEQVISGLKDGDRIVISGVNRISPGMKVREWIKERGL